MAKTELILTQPGYGWSSINLQNETTQFHFPVSYLTDIPADVLTGCIHFCKDGVSAIHFDGESEGELTLVLTQTELYVITDDSFLRFDMSGDTFCTNILHDIRQHMKDWCMFNVDYDDELTAESEHTRLTALCTTLETELQKNNVITHPPKAELRLGFCTQNRTICYENT